MSRPYTRIEVPSELELALRRLADAASHLALAARAGEADAAAIRVRVEQHLAQS